MAAAAAGLLCVGLPLLLSGVGAAASPRCTILGTSKADYLHGKPGPDVICGRGGKDQIAGGPGFDRVIGGPGSDWLAGGPGRDILVGGLGTDSCIDDRATTRRGCELPARRRPEHATWRPRDCCFGEPIEAEAPELFWMSFGRRFVDTSEPEPQIGLHLEVWDSSGVRSIGIQIEGPEGLWRTLDLDGDPTPLTTIELPLDVPASTPAGEYLVSRLTLTDTRGNTSSRSAAELTERAFGAEFSVFHGPDDEAPELTEFSIPGEVDTTEGPVDVPLTIGARDAVSGVDAVVATVEPPDDESPWIVIGGGFDDKSHLASGSKFDGTWLRIEHLEADARLGYYRVVSVRLLDIAGHQRNYNAQELQDLGYPVEFLDTGGPDTTPPEILDFWFEPSTLRTSQGERTIEFYTRVRDDITGIPSWSPPGPAGTAVEIEPAFPWTEFSNSGKVPVLFSGSHVDGVWQQEVSLEEDALAGTYQASYVGATDRAGNNTHLLIPELEARGFPHTFVNEP